MRPDRIGLYELIAFHVSNSGNLEIKVTFQIILYSRSASPFEQTVHVQHKTSHYSTKQKKMTSISHLRLDPTIFNQVLYDCILALWFRSHPHPPLADETDNARWMGVGATPEAKASFDEQCRQISDAALSYLSPTNLQLPRFTTAAEDAANHTLFAAPFLSQFTSISHTKKQNQDAALALTLLLDQLPRNSFRGPAQRIVYEHYDRLSRAVNAAVLATGIDECERFARVVGWRMWFYLTLMHSEDERDHELLRRKNEEQIAWAEKEEDGQALELLRKGEKFRVLHTDPLRRYRRYPWRNKWLGRESTVEEQRYLDEGGLTFGTSGTE